uniref:NADH-ubiquinone oxidoreductase chain 4L n=1 Tax=Gymnomuraena zebra TaxID=876649 RepID=A0A0U2C1D0_9TELE|nr:NADH dehydrogenase subunit 4L [Gymnomuraena zebra]AKI32572.1 NADH dehydrogenase subunit 4L [Gymnomuraena zebra]WNH38141.1 NADH dehydrogenase subunit 4L [Gymnomuraena zebra]
MTPSQLTFTMAFTLGLSGLAFHRKHLLSALLCLEAMMLALFVAMALWSTQMNSNAFSPAPMMLLAFSACEASAGLALLVATSRTHGTDHLKALNLLQC